MTKTLPKTNTMKYPFEEKYDLVPGAPLCFDKEKNGFRVDLRVLPIEVVDQLFAKGHLEDILKEKSKKPAKQNDKPVAEA